MSFQHAQAAQTWSQMSLVEQLANVGSEVSRALIWKEKKHQQYQDLSFWRAIELLDFTIECHVHSPSTLRELTRLKEVLGDFFVGENHYSSTPDLWRRYFYSFTYRAAVLRGV